MTGIGEVNCKVITRGKVRVKFCEIYFGDILKRLSV